MFKLHKLESGQLNGPNLITSVQNLLEEKIPQGKEDFANF